MQPSFHVYFRMLYEDFVAQYSLLFRLDDQEGAPKIPQEENQEEDKENQMFFEPLDVLYQKQMRLTPKRKSTPKKRLRRRAGEDISSTFNPDLNSAFCSRLI